MCKLCGGELCLLGILGRMIHLICRDCGMQFSRLASRSEAEEIEQGEY